MARSFRLWNVDAASVDYNMANLQSIEDLSQPLDAIRNLKVIDKLPILFLDEFDSDKRNYSLLLPLLWDGELHIGHSNLMLGKLVIILAGMMFHFNVSSGGKPSNSVANPAGSVNSTFGRVDVKLIARGQTYCTFTAHIHKLLIINGAGEGNRTLISITAILQRSDFSQKSD